MLRTDRIVLRNILLLESMLERLQAVIDGEQERVIHDLVSPTRVVVNKLIALDNRRIDLCNIKALNGFIRRGLGEDYDAFRSAAISGEDGALFMKAAREMERAGYTIARAADEFGYLFKSIVGDEKNVKPRTAKKCSHAFINSPPKRFIRKAGAV